MSKPGCAVKTTEPIVTHVTEVKISLLPEENPLKKLAGNNAPVTQAMVIETGEYLSNHYKRVASMLDVLERHGFTLRAGKNAVFCFSDEVEAQVAKRLLLEAGFKDRDFQITLVYTRGWGML